ncbi:MAG: hypothetical protein ACJA08_003469 [Cyclobacteriaceae bacterium]
MSHSLFLYTGSSGYLPDLVKVYREGKSNWVAYCQISETMTDITIASTNVTPFVKIDSEKSYIIFKGKSSPANSLLFYHPLIVKIKSLFSDSTQPITVELAFRYFNTSSSKCLFDLFKMLKGLKNQGKTLIINWHYEEDDDDMFETGEDYAEILGLDFNFVMDKEEERTLFLVA